MKNLALRSFALLLTLVCVLFSNATYSQQTLTQINGWNAYVHLPSSYGTGNRSYPTIVFFPGLGEVGTNAAAVISNGPGAYIAQGWNGNVVVDGNTIEFIVISLQTPSSYPTEPTINQRIQTIKSLYRVDNNRLYLTGLSHGGWCSTTFVTGDAASGPYTYASQIAAVVEVEGVVPDDNSPYPNLFDNFANSGGRLLGFEQKFDNRGMPTRINRMNATKANSGIYVQTNFGGGGHCCWNQFYGGQGTQPGNFSLDGINQNLYQWLARQSLGGGATPVPNQAPVANAGADKMLTLPANSTTLAGAGTDADGTIASYAWSKVSGPSTGTLANASNATANLSALVQGTYIYQLKVTDNAGAIGTDQVTVIVNAAANVAPTANAGSDKTITLPANSVTLAGTGADTDGTISSYLWTKISGSSATILSPTSATTNITGLVAGSYVFQLKVTDNAGATGISSVKVNVNAAPVGSCNQAVPKTYLLTQTSPGEIYRPNGSAWKGGDTIKITGTSYTVIEFNNIGGDECRPLVIMPLTTVTTPAFRFKNNCRYIKVWGGNTPYGIKVNGGPLAITSCHHIEADNIECTGGSTGIYCKQDVVYDEPMTWGDNYRMTKFSFKNMWIHDVDGEGMYIGITQPSGLTVKSTWSGLDTTIVPIRLDSVEIANCIVERCAWDGIQLSNARNGNSIHDNIVRNFGTINKSSQQAGIILGGNSNGDVYNNTIIKGTGNGIEIFGYGVINLYGNSLDSCGYDGNTNPNGTQGQHSIYGSDNTSVVEANPKQTLNIYNNAVNHPMSTGAIYIGGEFNNSFPSSVYNNTFCIPNAPGNWQSVYIKSYVAGSTSSNNTLYCGAGTLPPNQLPTANAGPDKTITLPVNTVTLTGSGTDSDGSIAAYAWRQVSGPGNSSIAAAQNASTAINNLVEGVYVIELQVTDNAGGIGKDSVTIMVNKANSTYLPAVNPANPVNGLDYKYYEGTWDALPNFDALTPLKAGTVAGFDLSLAAKADYFGFSFKGYVQVPADAVYTFYTASDDGSKLFIDNVEVVNNDGLHSDAEKSGTIGLAAGKHAITVVYFEKTGGNTLTASIHGGSLTKQLIPSNLLYRSGAANIAPTANAGSTQNITLPSNSVSLSGSGADADGTISSYSWAKISGPATGNISNANAALTTVTGLTEGTYQFRLTVTDNAGATATATTQVVVNAALAGVKIVRVNLFGGSNGHTDTRWNNWNISASINSANFMYEDRTTSNIKATLGGDIMVVDNGAGYANGATATDAPVLRYNTAATSQRDLTIKGLSPSKIYTMEFYGSRNNTGNRTLVVINGKMDTINTDKNSSDFARFVDVTPNASGTVIVNLSRIGVWNYLAGFTITEQGDASGTVAGNNPYGKSGNQTYVGEDLVELGANAVSVYPNPFVSSFKVQLNNKAVGDYVLKLSSPAGQVVYYKKVNKASASTVETINVSNLVSGTYVLQIISVATGQQTVHKVIKN